jgi:hypothetical protein
VIYDDGHPSQLRWAAPGMASSEGQREIIIALLNLTHEVQRIADHFDPEVRQ